MSSRLLMKRNRRWSGFTLHLIEAGSSVTHPGAKPALPMLQPPHLPWVPPATRKIKALPSEGAGSL
ncbi:hypothetical protein Nmel_000354 [Mimus melanotis]